jgi:threonine dehydrogenase-like Zn-dependent dehydrogenase
MLRLLETVRTGRFDPLPLITHTFPLDRIRDAYRFFGERGDSVLKVAIRP